MAKRTTMRSRSGKKLYAVREKSGRFKDIQTYERAHRQDMQRKSKAEKRAAGRSALPARNALPARSAQPARSVRGVAHL